MKTSEICGIKVSESLSIKIVVPISGGKDSQACLKLALESYDKSEVMGGGR